MCERTLTLVYILHLQRVNIFNYCQHAENNVVLVLHATVYFHIFSGTSVIVCQITLLHVVNGFDDIHNSILCAMHT